MSKFFLFFAIMPFYLSALSLKDKFYSAEPGDYLVTQANQIVNMILIRKNGEDQLHVEEFSVEKKKLTSSMKTWVEQGANQASSHHLFVFDKKQNKLISLVCLLTHQNLVISSEASLLFTELFFLPLKSLPLQDRKKIGPPPENGEPDHRPLWYPEWIFEGRSKKIRYDVFTIVWPNDGSFFSEKFLELYFAQNFPLPIWIEAKTLPIKLILHAIDSGKNFFPKSSEKPK